MSAAQPPSDPRSADPRDILASGGEVGRDLLHVDWASTPLGDPSQWPQSLLTVVDVVLSSRFSMWMAWGPQLTFLCNDAYRRDTLATKYPWALGRPAGEVWAEIWPDIGPRIERVMRTGEATWDESLLLFLERSGYPEETYHTFSYLPLRDDDGVIAGMLCVVSEDTERVIGERRMSALRDVAAGLAAAREEPEVLAAARGAMERHGATVPFALLYLLDADDGVARLGLAAGVDAGHPAAPELLEPAAEHPWPLGTALQTGEPVVVDALEERFDDLPTGPWAEPPQQALAVPLPGRGEGRADGVLVVGVNRYRPLDDSYKDFLVLLAGQLAAGLASARDYEAERRRAEQLAELDRAKTAFFTNISHELRTPLTLQLAPAEDALADREEPLGPGQRRRVEVLHRNAQRLLKLVNSLLDFSRLESGRATGRFEPVDLGRYTAELASMFSSATDRAGLQLRIEGRDLGVIAHVDREMWAKIVLNLLSNALKFTFEGSIDVVIEETGGAVRLRVSDTGIGIDAADQPLLFERFERVAGAAARSHEGSGIGLALVAELAALHGGEVGVESRPGHGSTFTVTIPLGHAHLPADLVSEGGGEAPPPSAQAAGYVSEAMRWLEDESARSRTVPAPAAAERGTRPSVLVVDDNADMREYIAGLLRDHYEVRLAADGEVALQAIRDAPPDLVLSDVMMPRLDGFGLLAAMQSDPETMHIPVILLSARAGEEGTVEGLDAGADDYLAKPFSARELLARVRANLELDRVRRTRDELQRSRELLAQAQRLAGVGSWEVDLASGAVTASEEFVRQMQLSPEERSTWNVEQALTTRTHPDDREMVRAAFDAAINQGQPLDYEGRVITPDGRTRRHRVLGQVDRDDEGRAVRLRGSMQDVTEQRAAEEALAAAAAAREAAEREHRIAEELQLSLLPPLRFSPDHLEIATFYQPGVEGTQVGGDWYDVIDLGRRRTALVLGDVVGRGIRAATVMGQLRTAVRAHARLGLPPDQVLNHLGATLDDIGDDQLATCVIAVYDPDAGTLTYANAGHPPPLLVLPDHRVERLLGSAGPPVGVGLQRPEAETIALSPGTAVVLYTDGLVERRGGDIDHEIDRMAAVLADGDVALTDMPRTIVDALLPDGPDDDVAILIATATDDPRPQRDADVAGAGATGRPRMPTAHLSLASEATAPARARAEIRRTFAGLPPERVHALVLVVTELVTNAVRHGQGEIVVHLEQAGEGVRGYVQDEGEGFAAARRSDPEQIGGWGLDIVRQLTTTFHTGGSPTRVSFTVAAS